MHTENVQFKGSLYYGNFIDAYLRGGYSANVVRPSTLELNKNDIRTDLRYIAVGMKKPQPWYVSVTKYDEIVSVQQNYFGYIKFKTIDSKRDFAFSCSDNNKLINELRAKGLESNKFLLLKIIPIYIQLMAILVVVIVIVGLLWTFVTRIVSSGA